MPLTKSYIMNFPNIGPVHAGVMVGALASVFSPALATVNEQNEKLLAQTANESSLPHMELDDSSRLSTPPEMEPVMDCSLVY